MHVIRGSGPEASLTLVIPPTALLDELDGELEVHGGLHHRRLPLTLPLPLTLTLSPTLTLTLHLSCSVWPLAW